MVPLGPIVKELLGLGITIGGMVMRSTLDAYRTQAARNAAAGLTHARAPVHRMMTREEAIEILNLTPKNKVKLSPEEIQQAKKNYEKYFKMNMPETNGPGGSAYLQGKIQGAFDDINKK